MMIVLVIEFARPYFEMIHEFKSDLHISVVDESSEIVDIVGRLVEIFDGNSVGIPKSYQVLKDKSIVFPQSTP